MTEIQKNAIRAFGEWLQDNKIGFIFILADEEDSTVAIKGNKIDLTAALAATLCEEESPLLNLFKDAANAILFDKTTGFPKKENG